VKWSGWPNSMATWEDVTALKQRFPRAPAWGQAGSQEGGNVSTPSSPARPATLRQSSRPKKPNACHWTGMGPLACMRATGLSPCTRTISMRVKGRERGEKQIVHVSSFLSCPLLFLPNPVLPIPEFDYPLFPTPCYLLAANNWYQISRSLGFFSSDLIL
jgi:hypothetical protein